MNTKQLFLISVSMVISGISFGQVERVDTAIINRIQNEVSRNSKVMDIAFQLTDMNGPRLTNSPGFMRAANYAKNQLAQWGLSDSKLDPFGEFGKGWQLDYFYMAMSAPYYKPLIAFPKAWCRSTDGLKSAEVLLIDAKQASDLEKYRGKLSGRIILLSKSIRLLHDVNMELKRWSEEELVKMNEASPNKPNNSSNAEVLERFQNIYRSTVEEKTLGSVLKEMAEKEGAVALLTSSYQSRNGSLDVSGSHTSRMATAEPVPEIVLGIEDFLTTIRLLRANVSVKIDLELKCQITSTDIRGYNVLAEIPGTDPLLKDEVVLIGAHLDSWHSSTGATDNAAGVAVIMEAMRILKILSVQPKRTLRIALWGGEEQGLLGSKGYVGRTFYDTSTKKLRPAYERFSVYFNLDYGGGKIRGIYSQGNESAQKIFKEWFAPFASVGASNVTNTMVGATDHTSFQRVGLPGFQFIQDPLEGAGTHHTNVDNLDHLIEEDLKTSSVIIASILYQAAMRDGKFPRK